VKFLVAKISPAAANLTKILAGKPKSRWPKSRQNPTANLAKTLAEKKINGSQNLGVILLGISPRFAVGSEILGEIHCGNLSKILDILPQISFGAIVFHIKVKTSQCLCA